MRTPVFAHLKSVGASALRFSVLTAVGAACVVMSAQHAHAQGGPPPPGAAPPGAAGPPSGPPPPDRPDAPGSSFDAALLADVLPPGNWPSPSPDPKNFEGFWYHYNPLLFQRTNDMYSAKTPLNAVGRALLAKRLASLTAGTPYLNASAVCLPTGQPLQFEINSPFVVYQNKDWLQFLFLQYHGVWTIVFDPEKQPDAGARPYMGRSVGHWDGDTLVVETSGFKQPLWLDVNGTPASADAKLTQRIRKVREGGRPGDWSLEIITSIDDPTYYTKPWSWAAVYVWRPDKAPIKEFDCEYQVNRPDYTSVSGLVPEPSN